MNRLDEAIIDRAEGCMLGQLAGDALGSLVEFQLPDEILYQYPDGVRVMADGGTFNTLAGQPTDDSEMALLLARSLVKRGSYDAPTVRKAYQWWVDSGPFDMGNTIYQAFRGNRSFTSEANGAMMRISPLGIFGAKHDLEEVARWAQEDAAITHPNRICMQANAMYAMAIAHAIRTGAKAGELYASMLLWMREMDIEQKLSEIIQRAAEEKPADFVILQGWVLKAFQNALYQLLHTSSVEEGVVNTIMQGGDTDTNAAIAGALLGAVHGRKSIPETWIITLQNCRPEVNQPNVHRPRPECLWPVDALELARQLL